MNASPVDDIFAPESAAESAVAIANGLVICELSHAALVIPQADILTIEQGSELSQSLPGESAYGWFACPHGPWPVYALSDRLQVVQQLDQPRSFIVFLHSTPWPQGILVSSVRIVGKQSDLSVQPLPRPFSDSAGGINGVVRLDAHRLAYVFAARRVIELLTDEHARPEVRYG